MRILGRINRFGERIAVHITRAVATLACFIVFNFIAVAGELWPKAGPFVAWLSSNYLQLVLLSVIMMGQEVAGRKAERRAQRDHELITRIEERLGRLEVR